MLGRVVGQWAFPVLLAAAFGASVYIQSLREEIQALEGEIGMLELEIVTQKITIEGLSRDMLVDTQEKMRREAIENLDGDALWDLGREWLLAPGDSAGGEAPGDPPGSGLLPGGGGPSVD